MTQTPTHARLLLGIALHEAASRRELSEDPERLLTILGPAIEQIEAEARAIQNTAAAAREALKREVRERAAERVTLQRLRERAEQDALRFADLAPGDPFRRPLSCYVYFLWGRSDEVLYVGLSTNVLRRVGQHLATARGHLVGGISAIECPDVATMTRLEAAAIRELQPPWNVLGIVA